MELSKLLFELSELFFPKFNYYKNRYFSLDSLLIAYKDSVTFLKLSIRTDVFFLLLDSFWLSSIKFSSSKASSSD